MCCRISFSINIAQTTAQVRDFHSGVFKVMLLQPLLQLSLPYYLFLMSARCSPPLLHKSEPESRARCARLVIPLHSRLSVVVRWKRAFPQPRLIHAAVPIPTRPCWRPRPETSTCSPAKLTPVKRSSSTGTSPRPTTKLRQSSLRISPLRKAQSRETVRRMLAVRPVH